MILTNNGYNDQILPYILFPLPYAVYPLRPLRPRALTLFPPRGIALLSSVLFVYVLGLFWLYVLYLFLYLVWIIVQIVSIIIAVQSSISLAMNSGSIN